MESAELEVTATAEGFTAKLKRIRLLTLRSEHKAHTKQDVAKDARQMGILIRELLHDVETGRVVIIESDP